MLKEHVHSDICTCGSHILTQAKVNRVDPTRTIALRNSFARQMIKRFKELNTIIYKAIVIQDCFGLQSTQELTGYTMQIPPREAFEFLTSQEKVAEFMRWLQEQVNEGILQVSQMRQIGQAVQSAWTDLYVADSYKRGIIRARYELNDIGFNVPSIEAIGGVGISMSTPFHMDRVGLLYTRVYNDLKGITDTMATQISRILAQGMIDGDGPKLLARKIAAVITGKGDTLALTDSLGRFIPAMRRAEVLARTEIIRAHHVATIQEYRSWGVVGIKVRAEWQTAGDSRVCERCASLQGKIFTLDEIEGMIPLHPQCRCIALPTLPEGYIPPNV